MTSADFLPFVVTTLSELTRPPRVRVHSFTSCNCRLYIRRFRLVFGLRVILHSHPLRLPIDDFCSSVQGFAICFFQPVHHCTHLADSLALPTSGRARDFHPLDCTHADQVLRVMNKSSRVIQKLFEQFTSYPELLPPSFYEKPLTRGVQRAVADYIAGMTDRYAVKEYERVFNPSLRGIKLNKKKRLIKTVSLMRLTARQSLISGLFLLKPVRKDEALRSRRYPRKKGAYLIKVEREFRPHPSVGGHGSSTVAVGDMNQPADKNKECDKNCNLRQVRLLRIDKLRHQ